jgi:hypothetical protein
MDGRTGGPTIPLPEPRTGPPVEQADQPLRLKAIVSVVHPEANSANNGLGLLVTMLFLAPGS